MNICKSTIMTIAASFTMLCAAGQFDTYNYVKEILDSPDFNKPNTEANAKFKALTDDQWLEYFDQYAATNKSLYTATGKRQALIQKSSPLEKIRTISKQRFGDNRLCTVYDTKFADAGIYLKYTNEFSFMFFRKMCDAAYEEMGEAAYAKHRAEHAILVNRISDGISESGNVRPTIPPEFINILVEKIGTGLMSIKSSDETIKSACRQAVKPIKRKIREEGGSFVVGADGVNSVQVAIDALVSAFQSPNCSGVKEWVARWFPDYKWIDVDDYFSSAEDIANLKDKVFYGDADLTEAISRKLYFGLGLDEYNKFIKVYNGDK